MQNLHNSFCGFSEDNGWKAHNWSNIEQLSIIKILEKNWMQVIKKHILIKSQAFDLVMDDEAGSFTNFISLLN